MPCNAPASKAPLRNASSMRRQIVVPGRLLHFRADAAVGEYFDVAVHELEVDEHAAVVLGVPHRELSEHFARALARRDSPHEGNGRKSRLHGETQLAVV